MTHRLATILPGDCRETLKSLPAKSVHCVMTSPPYFSLRSYLPADHSDKSLEIGREPTPDEFVATMVEVFREVRRVLRDDGVCWVNFGDSYAGGLAAGNLLNIPHRVAAALQSDGWTWRQTLIFAKRSPMPESLDGTRWVRCRSKINGTGWTKSTHPSPNPSAFGRTDTFGSGGDNKPNPYAAKFRDCHGCDKCRANGGYVLRRGSWRCTTAHEYLFMFTKGMNYFSSADQVAERSAEPNRKRNDRIGGANGHIPRHSLGAMAGGVETRNPRSIWTLSHEPTKVRHFAAYPSRLCRIPILSSTSNVGCCPACGDQYAPVIERERVSTRPGINNKIWKHDESGDVLQQRSDASPNLDPQRHITRKQVIGHRPTCGCDAGDPVPSTVLDPFMGTGTTGQVAVHLGRQFIGCELSGEYIAFAEQRIANPPKWLRTRDPKKRTSYLPCQLSLFNQD